MNTKQEDLRKEIVSLQKSMKSLLNTVNDLFEIMKDNRGFIENNAKLLHKTTAVLKDLAEIAGGTMKVDAEEIKVSNKINGGIPKINKELFDGDGKLESADDNYKIESIKKPKSMKDIGMIDLSTPKAQEDFLKKVKKLNEKYNES